MVTPLMSYCPTWKHTHELIADSVLSVPTGPGGSTGDLSSDTTRAPLTVASRTRASGAPEAPASAVSPVSPVSPTSPAPIASVALSEFDFAGRAAAARPRLAVIARSFGIEPDAVDDVIQDTLLMAWWRRTQLRSPERFDAWLDAICRNRCRQHLRVRIPVARRQGGPTVLSLDRLRGDEGAVAANLPDPQAADPLAELDRRDLTALLDHALGRLPPPAREVLELRYLEDLPEAHAAHRLGVSVSALEARLHRARRQLRHVLSGAMRTEASEMGLLTSGSGDLDTWQETRLWCDLCGRRRLWGIFERQTDGATRLRLRCPDCSVRYGCDIYGDFGMASLEGMRSFGAALNRTMRFLVERGISHLAEGRGPCPHCGLIVPVRVIGPDANADTSDGSADSMPKQLHPLHTMSDIPSRCWIAFECPAHGKCLTHSAVEPVTWFHPAAQRFMANHPRWITTPEVVADYAGQPAVRFRLVDVMSTAQFVLFADPITLRVLAAFEE